MPLRITSLPSVSTVTRLASISALRFNASCIFCLISAGFARGLSTIRFAIPFTPRTRCTAFSAVFFWYWPLGLAFERYPAIPDYDLDGFEKHRELALDRGHGVTRDVRIGSLVGGRQTHFEVVGYGSDTRDAFRC